MVEFSHDNRLFFGTKSDHIGSFAVQTWVFLARLNFGLGYTATAQFIATGFRFLPRTETLSTSPLSKLNDPHTTTKGFV
jgi:hypothetical protein